MGDQTAGKGAKDRWSTDVYDSTFQRWFAKELDQYEQVVLDAAIENILEVYGIDICEGEWGKALGHGLYEFRVRQSLHAIRTHGMATPPAAKPGEDRTVLLRVFVTFHGAKVVLLLHGLNKGKDSSPRRQNAEIARARKLLKQWQRESRSHRKR
jgi:hypothetical protein